MQRKDRLDTIDDDLASFYKQLNTEAKERTADYYYQCVACLKNEDIKGAYLNYKNLCHLANVSNERIDELFLPLIQGEDFINENSFLLIRDDSPFYSDLRNASKKLGFKLSTHSCSVMGMNVWTKDYVISAGDEVFFPSHTKRQDHIEGLMDKPSVRDNPSLYYGKLKIDEHHTPRTALNERKKWYIHSENILSDSTPLKKVMLEGGNFFCAINKKNEKFFLIGENVLSETRLYHDIGREQAIDLLAKDLGCSSNKILIIPQWAYHLDLQMGYLGKGQFIVHSFDQKNFEFGLVDGIQDKTKKTFDFLRDQFEEDIIDKVCALLKKHDFSVEKVFGCLFYLNDVTDKNELQYVPKCKNSAEGDGSLAFLMNGVAGKTDHGDQYFLTARCENEPFKDQFEISLNKLGCKVEYIDMLDCYDEFDEFDGFAIGLPEVTSVGAYMALMSGGLRCQTSVLNEAAQPKLSKEVPRSVINRYHLMNDSATKVQDLPGDETPSSKMKDIFKKR